MTGASLPPTTKELLDPGSRPYFVWWMGGLTVAEFRVRLADADEGTRAYWLGALLREANSRDVWLFTTPAELRALWPRLLPHLGKKRALWAWLLQLGDATWPPPEARGG